MSTRTAIRKRIRLAVAGIGLWLLIFDAFVALALLVKGLPHQLVWQRGHFVAGPVRWTFQDTAILAVLLALQSFVFVFFKIVRNKCARAKSGQWNETSFSDRNGTLGR
jgi:hypothetical protein